MKTAMKTYCSRESEVQAVRWDEDPDTYHFLQSWAGKNVRVAGNVLILQTPGLVEQVKPGDYIVMVGTGNFHVFTPEDFIELYTPVIG